jgi:hypothetical protein
MNDSPRDTKVSCERFLNELEELEVGGPGAATAKELLTRMPGAVREHAAQCTSCEEALQDFAVTRRELIAMREGLPEGGPWFAARVMAAIRTKEAEIEEKREGVWVNVRRLAPRLVAFAAVLLVLGGTWAFEVHRAEPSRGPEIGPVESLFEAAPSAPLNDDIVASTYPEQAP